MIDPSAPEMQPIIQAIGLLHTAPAQGRARLLALWDEHAANGARLPMCAIAHFLADEQSNPSDELEWDLRALEAATGGREAEDREPLSPPLAAFLPSLHGSAASGYRKLGDLDRARRHLAVALARAPALADDAYGAQVRGVLARLQMALA